MRRIMPDGRLRIGIISAGRVGCALGSALRALGHTIVGAYARSEASRDRLDAMLPGVAELSVEEIIAASDCVLLALPDDELPGLVRGAAELNLWRPGQLVVHVAGRYGIGVLEPAAQRGALTLAMHPAMTFTGTSLDVARLTGCPFAVTGTPLLLPIVQALVTELGGRPFVVAEENRGLYHAALAHGANHLVTLVAQSMRMLEAAGIDDPGAYARPLMEAALEGVLSSGESLLTGPVARGDIGTVDEHVHAIDALALLAHEDSEPENGDEYRSSSFADIPPVYRALVTATAQRAAARRALREPTAQRIVELMRETNPSA
ncbi:DUF2520 domain-containing protein [Arcanobacterium haemolyticum]|nr:DUF2520 domain-containing protein [Arcanobacterium haemolyticum]